MKSLMIIATAALTAMGSSLGEDAAEKSAHAAVAANDRAYEAAYARGDIKALADFFTDDVVYTDELGNTHKGKSEIESSLAAAFAANPGAKLAITLEEVRVLSPDVVVENGSTTVVAKDGEAASALFTAIHVKKDAQWKISQLVETPAPAITPSQRLSELTWLIGDWSESDKEAGVTINSRIQWARGGSFITRNVTVKRNDVPLLEGWQIIGWDPVEESIRSWTFDGEGGFSGGLWTRDGKRWLVRETGYTADGGRISSDATITKSGDDRFYWEAGNRALNGEPQPAIERIAISRVKGK